jgi:hypothetical protein
MAMSMAPVAAPGLPWPSRKFCASGCAGWQAREQAGLLVPDWRNTHVVRLPGHAFLIVPALFTPSVNNGQAVMSGSGALRTLSDYIVGSGASTLVACVHVWHTSQVRTITGVTFNGNAMSAGTTNGTNAGDGGFRTTLYYQHAPDITQANIVATFNNSGTNSGIAACWVTELAASAPEAGASDYFNEDDTTDLTVTVTSVTDNAIIFAGAGLWADLNSAVAGTTEIVRSAAVSSHIVLLGYRIGAAAGNYALGWNIDDAAGNIVVNSFAVTAGGGPAAFVPLLRRRSSLICR